jgi:hypothetical protein
MIRFEKSCQLSAVSKTAFSSQLSAISRTKGKEGKKQIQRRSEEVVPMIYKGIVKGKVIELEGEAILPEGTRVSIVPEQFVPVTVPQHPMTLREWLQEARQVRAQLPKTSDSVEILWQIRQERASR